MDKSNIMFNFEKDQFVVNCMDMRMSINVPWKFFPDDKISSPDSVWNVAPELKSDLQNVLQGIFDYWLAGDGPDGKSLSTARCVESAFLYNV